MAKKKGKKAVKKENTGSLNIKKIARIFITIGIIVTFIACIINEPAWTLFITAILIFVVTPIVWVICLLLGAIGLAGLTVSEKAKGVWAYLHTDDAKKNKKKK